jgi:hypothetical protein
MTTDLSRASSPEGARQQVSPRSFKELSELSPQLACNHCGERRSTHAISITVAKLGGGKGAIEKQIRAKPVCEQCAVKIWLINSKALRSLP